MRIVIACVLACIPVSAFAADWLPLGRTSTGSAGYIDFQSIDRTKPDRPSGWVKWDNSKDRTEKSRETKELVEANCAGRRLRTVSWVAYDAIGKVIQSGPVYASTLDFEPVVPESMGAVVFSVLCPEKPIEVTDPDATDQNLTTDGLSIPN